MNKTLIAVIMTALVFGCATSSNNPTLPATLENVSVSAPSRNALKKAIIQAATRRKWMPSELDANTIRCTLTQRDHRVVVDIKILDDRHYSMLSAESNIPERKFLQWRNNLQREIAKQACDLMSL